MIGVSGIHGKEAGGWGGGVEGGPGNKVSPMLDGMKAGREGCVAMSNSCLLEDWAPPGTTAMKYSNTNCPTFLDTSVQCQTVC